MKKFAAADNARTVLFHAGYQQVDRATAALMVAALLGTFGAKSDKDLLAGMLDMLEGDEIAIASGLWHPLRVTPAMLAIACRKLIATATFPPRPAELYAACREASRSLRSAHDACDGLCDYVRRLDAVLLQFAPEQWREPYLTAQYRPIVQRMLSLHECFGDGFGKLRLGRGRGRGHAAGRVARGGRTRAGGTGAAGTGAGCAD